jgi:WD40 repeat protein
VAIWQAQSAAASESVVPLLTPIVTFGEHTQPVTSVVANTAQSRLASTSLDGTAKIWAAAVAGDLLCTLDHLPQQSWCDVQAHCAAWLDTSGQVLATGASDGVVRVWDLRATSTPAAQRFAPHTAPLLCLSPGATESQLIAGGECGTLQLLDIRRLDEEVTTAKAVHGDAPLCSLALSQGATPRIAIGGEDGGVAVADPRDLQCITRERVHTGRVAGLSWLPSNSALLTGGWDKQLLRVTLGAQDFAPMST